MKERIARAGSSGSGSPPPCAYGTVFVIVCDMTDSMRSTYDAVVIGGGIIGCAVARSAALAGLSVALMDRGEPGSEATWAAGGMLSPYSEAENPGPFYRLAVESLRRYRAFARAVEAESGRSVHLLETGKMEIALDDRGETRLRSRFRWLRDEGVRATWLDPDDARRKEPSLSPELRGSLLLEEEAQVDNRLLGPALAEAARAAGATIREGTAVREILRNGGHAKGVRTDEGDVVHAPLVVVSAGAWSGGLEGLPRRLPVRPVRGQMLSLGPPAGTLRTVVASSHTYLVPRSSGPVVVGSTMEEEGFAAHTTARALQELLGAALAAAPGLSDAPLVESWAGLRPGTPDDLPILGLDPDVQGLVYATGHFRNGILLAPVTADCITPLLTGDGEPPLDLAPYRADRFPDSGEDLDAG